MKGKRRKITAEFKTQVVLEALKDRMTLAEMSTKFNVAGSQISSWKTEFVKNASSVFGSNNVTNNEEEMEKLYCKIGQLQLENDYLKKTLR
jgi:transposase-like protein